jgi:hypothetical protein
MVTCARPLLLSFAALAIGCSDPAKPTPVPTTLTAALSLPASATVGSAVAPNAVVVVKDQEGVVMAAIPVTFAVSGGGTLATASAVTDAGGLATPGLWMLGRTAGANVLTATVAGVAPLTFTVTGVAGPPSALTKESGDSQVGTVGTAVAVRPSVTVRDDFGNGVANVAVTFAAAQGTVSGATQMTGANGSATVGGWTLGTVAGAQLMTASVGSLQSVTFEATATPAAASALVKLAGDNQTAAVSTPVSTAPSVRVQDAHGNAVSGTPVTFSVTAGGGTVTGASVSSNSQGIATVGGWTVGAAAGSNVLTASIQGASVTFGATAVTTLDPCTVATSMAVDSPVTASLASTDCQLGTGQRVDYYSITTSATQALLMTQSSSAFNTVLSLSTGTMLVGENNDFGGTTNSRFKVLVGPGTHTIAASSFEADRTGSYTVTAASTSSNITGCEVVFIPRGVSLTQTVATTDCVDTGPYYYDIVRVYLDAGAQVIVDMTSTAVDAFMEVYRISDGALMGFNDDRSPATTDARVVFTPTSSGFYWVLAETFFTSEVGEYVLTVTQGGPSAFRVRTGEERLAAGLQAALTSALAGEPSAWEERLRERLSIQGPATRRPVKGRR